MELLDDVGFLLSRSSGAVVRATNGTLSSLGLRVRHYSVLSVACDTGGISQRELAEILGLDPSQVVALVDELQGMDLVDRLPNPRDRRARLIVATHRGKELRVSARTAVREAAVQFLEPLDDAQRRQLAQLLRQLAFPDVLAASLGEAVS